MNRWISIALFAVLGWGAMELGKAIASDRQEYAVFITRNPPPAQIIGSIQVGLSKTEAEGVAFQLNEMFTREKLDWSAVAVVPPDISTLPKPVNVERSKPEAKH